MKSVFENIPDKIIFRLVKMIMEEVDFSELETSQDSELTDSISSVESYFGIRGEDYTIDADYIYNLWKLNIETFDEEKLTSPLYRPKFKQVSFDWHVWETQWVKIINEHKIETYGSDRDDIMNYVYGLRNDGNLNWYDGKEINSEVTESETTDDDIDDNSFKIL
jgi:hypothetical protein